MNAKRSTASVTDAATPRITVRDRFRQHLYAMWEAQQLTYAQMDRILALGYDLEVDAWRRGLYAAPLAAVEAAGE